MKRDVHTWGETSMGRTVRGAISPDAVYTIQTTKTRKSNKVRKNTHGRRCSIRNVRYGYFIRLKRRSHRTRCRAPCCVVFAVMKTFISP